MSSNRWTPDYSSDTLDRCERRTRQLEALLEHIDQQEHELEANAQRAQRELEALEAEALEDVAQIEAAEREAQAVERLALETLEEREAREIQEAAQRDAARWTGRPANGLAYPAKQVMP